jgi:hypothetical protein
MLGHLLPSISTRDLRVGGMAMLPNKFLPKSQSGNSPLCIQYMPLPPHPQTWLGGHTWPKPLGLSPSPPPHMSPVWPQHAGEDAITQPLCCALRTAQMINTKAGLRAHHTLTYHSTTVTATALRRLLASEVQDLTECLRQPQAAELQGARPDWQPHCTVQSVQTQRRRQQ